MAITSVVFCMQHIHTGFGFVIGYTIREVTCDTPAHKGQSGITMATNFRTKVAINAYKCISKRDSENMHVTNSRGFSWSTSPKKTFLIARVLRGYVSMATKFWPK